MNVVCYIQWRRYNIHTLTTHYVYTNIYVTVSIWFSLGNSFFMTMIFSFPSTCSVVWYHEWIMFVFCHSIILILQQIMSSIVRDSYVVIFLSFYSTVCDRIYLYYCPSYCLVPFVILLTCRVSCFLQILWEISWKAVWFQRCDWCFNFYIITKPESYEFRFKVSLYMLVTCW